jgi:Protein of unknown function (DUF2891)
MKIPALLAFLLVISPLAAEERIVTEELAAGFARLALAGVDREYPNKPGNAMASTEDVKSPKALHPVFFGNYDWHSAVHGHWLLLKLMERYPESTFAEDIRKTLDRKLNREDLLTEAAYFDRKENRSFERMYGWAWALRLGQELRQAKDPHAAQWAANYRPLEEKIVQLAKDYLPKLDWPVRCGFHPESSFALAQMLDYARAVGDTSFEQLIKTKSLAFYGQDRDYPSLYEPSGNDFFSPGLNVADLMRRVLGPQEYQEWLSRYLPQLAEGKAGHLLTPVTPSDMEDGQIVHLVGLNLNRAWDMYGMASSLPAGDPRRKVLLDAARRHLDAGLPQVFSGHYEGEHWLASFALSALDARQAVGEK